MESNEELVMEVLSMEVLSMFEYNHGKDHNKVITNTTLTHLYFMTNNNSDLEYVFEITMANL